MEVERHMANVRDFEIGLYGKVIRDRKMSIGGRRGKPMRSMELDCPVADGQ